MEPESPSNEEVLIQLDNFPKAGEFINAALALEHRVICYGGSIRGGKTFSAIGALVLLHKAYPNTRSIIVRENLDVLRKNTLPSCVKAIPTNFVQQFKGDPHFEWTFTNGSKMFFFAEGYEKDKEFNRWNGLEVNFILLEQVEELQEEALQKAIERAGAYVVPKGYIQPNPLIMMTVNPTKTWAKDLIYDRYINDTLPDNWLYIPALLTDNPHIPDSFKEGLQELKRLNPIKYQRFVEGDWEVEDTVEGAFYKSFTQEGNVGKYRYNRTLPLHITFDFNVNPYMSVAIHHIDKQEHNGEVVAKYLVQIAEITGESPNNTTKAVCRKIKQMYRGHRVGMFIYGDPSGKHADTRSEEGYNDYDIIKQELAEFKPQFRVAKSAPPVVMRGQFINTIFEQGYAGIEIVIDEGCKHTIKDYTFLLEDSDGTKKKTKKTDSKTKISYEELGHLSDANDYLICEAFKHEFRRYQRGTTITDITVSHTRKKAY